MHVYHVYRWDSTAPAHKQGWHTLGQRSRTPHSVPRYLVHSGTIHRATAVGRGREKKSGSDDSFGFTLMNVFLHAWVSATIKTKVAELWKANDKLRKEYSNQISNSFVQPWKNKSTFLCLSFCVTPYCNSRNQSETMPWNDIWLSGITQLIVNDLFLTNSV